MTAPEYPGVRLVDEAELLRRVAPFGKGKGAAGSTPGNEAFKPEPAAAAFKPGGRGSHDNGGLSTKRAAEEPEAAYWAYLRSGKEPGSRMALGTWGFKVGEADSLRLPSYGDGGIDEDRPENHATVWFPMPAELSNTQLKLSHERLADDLRTFALEHGCLFRPADPQADALSLQATGDVTETPPMAATRGRLASVWARLSGAIRSGYARVRERIDGPSTDVPDTSSS